MKYNHFLCLLSLVLILGSCKQKDVIPAYIHVENFNLTTNSDQGSSHHQIEVAYVHVNNEFLGAYNLPVTIPVLQSGNQTVTITPGVYENGISNTPTINRFYKKYNVDVDLKVGVVDTIKPMTTYEKDVIFELIDDFNGSTSFRKDLDDDTETAISFIKNGFEGGSGYIYLEGNHDTIAVATYQNFDVIPANTIENVFIELDYKCSSLLRMGLEGVNTKGDTLFFFTNALNPTMEWNKVYFNIADPIINSEIKAYHIFFESTVPKGKENAEIWLDNFKFMHF